jgi:hypothetical protein
MDPRISSAPRRKGGVLRSIRGTCIDGNFCRSGINCRATGPFKVLKATFYWAFTMARRLLMLRL